jgi:outer membrane protein OmpA-like peptidoglycan-associated protein
MKRHLYAIPLAATLIVPAAFAQQSATPGATDNTPAQTQTQTQPAQTQPDTQTQSTQAPSDAATTTNGQYATGAPLQGQNKEGFWGHLMPFARKKYVARQMDPIRGRVNELDELTGKNASAIKDVDARATEGIRQATARAGEADQHAMAANQLATQANQTAQDANTRLQTVQHAVSGLDQYQPVTDAEIRFKPGQTKLGDQAKQALDQIADQLKGHNGYIVQVQGFSTTRGQAGIANSQAITQSVVRYLVTEHDVPLYRIYTLGMGNAEVKSAAPEATQTEAAQQATTAAPAKKFRGGRVEVALLKNGAADLGGNAVGATQSTTNPQAGVTPTPHQ